MKSLLVLSLLGVLVGCTAEIPVDDRLGTSAIVPGEMPVDFAQFNNYDPGVAQLLASQICATPYIQLDENTVAAEPGRILDWRGRCQTYYPSLGVYWGFGLYPYSGL